ncbi:glycosyltransferase family 4 protein [Geodermatophilus sp. SYSU D00814]
MTSRSFYNLVQVDVPNPRGLPILPRPRLLFVLSSAESAERLYAGQFSYLRDVGFDVAVVCPGGRIADMVSAREGVRVVGADLERGMSVLRDVRALLQVLNIVRRERPAALIYGTPKASLLASVAGALWRVPVRVYVLHGLRLETLTGAARRILRSFERMIGRLSTEIWSVSPSLHDLVLQEGIFPPDRTIVVGEGSCNGVDLERFNSADTSAARNALSLDEGTFVFIFIGRRTRDKGVHELIDAFQSLKNEGSAVKLLLLGSDDHTNPVDHKVRVAIAKDPDIVDCGDVPNPEVYLAAADALVLPTYREGMPGVLLEAAAAGCPIITTSATGARDVAADGRGFMVPVGDAGALTVAMRDVMAFPEATKSRRDRAQAWVRRHFARSDVWQRQEERLRHLLHHRGRREVRR